MACLSEYTLKWFAWSDIEKHIDRVVEMQTDNIYRFHYSKKKPDQDYVSKKVYELKNHLESGNTYFIAGISNNILCGFIWLYKTIFIDENRMVINSLYVCESARGTGLSYKLMGEAKKAANLNGCSSMVTHHTISNIRAGLFYEANGFTPSRIEVVMKL